MSHYSNSNKCVIDVYVCDLDIPEPRIHALKQLLSPDELARADAFRVPHARNHFVLCRAALRRLIAHSLSITPDGIRFGYGASGKPYLTHPHVDLFFNVSHSGTRGLVAIAAGQEIGVDVEQIRESPGLADVARQVFNPDELAHLRGLQPAHWLTRFYTLWTLKEACVKALGSGLTDDLQSLPTSTGRSITLEPGYAAAIAVASGSADYRMHPYVF